MSEWKPISTAPTDGSLRECLGFSPQLRIGGMSGIGIMTWRKMGFDVVYGEWTVSAHGMTASPTMWQPLPSPPKESSHDV